MGTSFRVAEDESRTLRGLARELRSIRCGRFHRRHGCRRGHRLSHRFCRALSRKHADEPTCAALIFKPHVSGDAGEKRIVFPSPNVQAGLMLSAPLANEDRPGIDQLPRKPLYAKPLPGRVAAID
jgi:hypothetical protein